MLKCVCVVVFFLLKSTQYSFSSFRFVSYPKGGEQIEMGLSVQNVAVI